MRFDFSDAAAIVFGVTSTLIVTLVLGAYAFTWNVMNNEQIEKQVWRNKHEQNMDKKFDELRKGQDELNAVIHEKTNDITDLLKKIIVLEEKYKLKERN